MRKKKKILFAIDRMSIGGAPSVVLKHIELIDRDEYEPFLLTLYRSKKANYLTQVRDLIGEANVVEFSLKNRSMFDVRTLYAIFNFLRKENFDVVYTHLFLASFLIRVVSVCARVPRIVTFEHSRYNNRSRWQKYLNRILSWWTDAFVVTNESTADFLSYNEGIQREKIHVVQLPIFATDIHEDICKKLRKNYNISETTYNVLSYGRFSEEKGFDTIIHIASRIREKEKDIRFYIVGHGAQESALRSLIKEKGLDDVCFVIHAPEEARLFLCLADLFVLPSRREGQSIVTGEAMQVGVPVVVSKLPSLEELVEDEVSGFLCDVDNVEGFARTITFLKNNPSTARSVGEAGREKIKLYQDSEVYIKKLDGILFPTP